MSSPLPTSLPSFASPEEPVTFKTAHTNFILKPNTVIMDASKDE
jgi:hypothetical protein